MTEPTVPNANLILKQCVEIYETLLVQKQGLDVFSAEYINLLTTNSLVGHVTAIDETQVELPSWKTIADKYLVLNAVLEDMRADMKNVFTSDADQVGITGPDFEEVQAPTLSSMQRKADKAYVKSSVAMSNSVIALRKARRALVEVEEVNDLAQNALDTAVLALGLAQSTTEGPGVDALNLIELLFTSANVTENVTILGTPLTLPAIPHISELAIAADTNATAASVLATAANDAAEIAVGQAAAALDVASAASTAANNAADAANAAADAANAATAAVGAVTGTVAANASGLAETRANQELIATSTDPEVTITQADGTTINVPTLYALGSGKTDVGDFDALAAVVAAQQIEYTILTDVLSQDVSVLQTTLDLVIGTVPTWDTGTTYTEDDLVLWSDNMVYYALQASTGQSPDDDLYWEPVSLVYLYNQVHLNDGTIATLVSDVASLQSTTSTLQDDLAVVTTNLSDLTDIVGTNGTSLDVLSSSLADLTDTVNGLDVGDHNRDVSLDLSISAGAVTVNYALGANYYDLSVNQNVGTWNFTSGPASNKGISYFIRIRMSSGGPYTVAWPASFVWTHATPTLSDDTTVTQLLVLNSVDEGTSYMATLYSSDPLDLDGLGTAAYLDAGLPGGVSTLNTEGYVPLEQMDPSLLGHAYPVVTVSGTSLAADASNSGNYTRFTGLTAKSYSFDTAETYVVGAEYHGRNVGTGDLTITEVGGMTINPPLDGTLVVPPNGWFAVKIVAADEADLRGDTVPV